MKAVNQSCLWDADGIGNGDCFNACLASLLELPLWMVPPFHLMMGRSERSARIQEWLKHFFGLEMVREENHEWQSLPAEFYIANGPSERGVWHSVIYSKGEPVHDPHPSQSGITAVDWTWHLQKVTAA